VRAAAKLEIENTRILCESVGLYLKWFGAVEHQIDRLTAHIMKLRDFEKYAILTKGATARDKCNKLIEVAKLYQPLGSKLQARIEHLQETIIPMRNVIAHSRLVLGKNKIIATQIDRMQDSVTNKVRPRNKPPQAWEITEVLKCALWLRDFEADLDEVAHSSWQRSRPKRCELIKPRSDLPKLHK